MSRSMRLQLSAEYGVLSCGPPGTSSLSEDLVQNYRYVVICSQFSEIKIPYGKSITISGHFYRLHNESYYDNSICKLSSAQRFARYPQCCVLQVEGVVFLISQ